MYRALFLSPATLLLSGLADAHTGDGLPHTHDNTLLWLGLSVLALGAAWLVYRLRQRRGPK